MHRSMHGADLLILFAKGSGVNPLEALGVRAMYLNYSIPEV